MRRFVTPFGCLAVTAALILLNAPPLAAQDNPPTGWTASGSHGAVAAGGAGAVEAGMTLLRQGGNAADAAVATILALSVTDANAFCFGGEVPASTRTVNVVTTVLPGATGLLVGVNTTASRAVGARAGVWPVRR